MIRTALVRQDTFPFINIRGIKHQVAGKLQESVGDLKKAVKDAKDNK